MRDNRVNLIGYPLFVTLIVCWLGSQVLGADLVARKGSPLLWKEKVKEMSVREAGEIYKTEFRLVNPTSEPIKVEKIITGCSCTVVGRRPDILMPMEESRIRIELGQEGGSLKPGSYSVVVYYKGYEVEDIAYVLLY